MTINRELCDIAQKWANHLAEKKAFEHSEQDGRKCSQGATGENLFYSGTTGDVELQGAAPVDSWYAEIKEYDFDKPGFAMNTGMTHLQNRCPRFHVSAIRSRAAHRADDGDRPH